MRELAELVDELRSAARDLDGHIERRAAELAAPIVAAAEARAQRRVEEAENRLVQANGIIGELRQQLEIQSRLHQELLAEKRAGRFGKKIDTTTGVAR